MAKIETFDAGNLALQPTEVGVEAAAGAGRRLGAFYNQVGEATQRFGERAGQEIGGAIRDAGQAAIDFEDHREISHGAATFATLTDNLTNQWNDAAKNADPNDPAVAAKFRETVLEPALEKFRDGFNTEKSQQFAESHIEQLRQHMFEKTSSDMSTLAGQAAKVNATQTVNTLSNTALNDPSALNFALKSFDTSVEGIVGSSPNLKGATAAAVRSEISEKGREQIVKSAALGAIMKTGELPAWTSDPQYSKYVNGIELKQLQQYAQTVQRMGQNEARSQRQEADYNNKKDFNAKMYDLEASTLPQKAGDRPTLPSDYWDKLRALSIHPGAALEPGRFKTMVQAGEALTDRLNKPEPLGPISHQTTMDLLKRIRATDDTRINDNGPIYDAYQQGKLNHQDFAFLNSEFNNLRTPEGQALDKDRGTFFKSYSRLIDGAMSTTGEHSLLGTQQAYQFEMDARHQEQVLRQQGRDPHLVYDPRSTEFFGRPENIGKYRVSLQEAQKYETDLKAMDAENAKGGGNLTGPSKTITRVDVQNAPIKPLQSDLDYVKAHPEARDKFIKRFGREP